MTAARPVSGVIHEPQNVTSYLHIPCTSRVFNALDNDEHIVHQPHPRGVLLSLYLVPDVDPGTRLIVYTFDTVINITRPSP